MLDSQVLAVAGIRSGFFLKPVLRRWLDAACGAFLIALGIRFALRHR